MEGDTVTTGTWEQLTERMQKLEEELRSLQKDIQLLRDAIHRMYEEQRRAQRFF